MLRWNIDMDSFKTKLILIAIVVLIHPDDNFAGKYEHINLLIYVITFIKIINRDCVIIIFPISY
jgi:hypothetical protein